MTAAMSRTASPSSGSGHQRPHLLHELPYTP